MHPKQIPIVIETRKFPELINDTKVDFYVKSLLLQPNSSSEASSSFSSSEAKINIYYKIRTQENGMGLKRYTGCF